MTTMFLLAVGLLIYTYAGYPLLLSLIVRIRGVRDVRRASIRPRVCLVISAYNEAAVIRQKLENACRLAYAPELLDIVVISDASNDGTDEIVREFAPRVRLLRQPVRRGKTAGLNRFLPTLACEVVVFSDANAIYAPDAIEKLVRNFADPEVGCVTGEARYLETGGSAADAGERAYWNYEIQIKRLETAVGSMVGGDGAIYGIRRELWRELPESAINDFLNPLQIVARGWRSVYEPEAVCSEETAGGVSREYRRRVRIVSRSWRAIFQAPAVLNPFAVGFFSLSVISHKILRWLSGAFVGLAAVSSVALLVRATIVSSTVLVTVALAVGLACLLIPSARRVSELALYFVAITGASLVGLIKGTIGRVSATWSTPRANAANERLFAPGLAILLLGVALATTVGVMVAVRSAVAALNVLFWVSVAMLAYVYVAYPIGLALVRSRLRRIARREAREPSVCLFITANDEAAVMHAKLTNSLALDYPREKLSVVVASDGSVDGTDDIVRSFEPAVRLMAFPERRGKIAAINEGVGSVDAEVIVFSDANTLLERDAIAALVRNFADPSVGAVSGDVILEGERAALGSSEDLYYRYERWLQSCESDVGTMVGVDGALYAIRRNLFVPPPSDTILDDMAIPMAVTRAGRRVVFEPEAIAHERGCETATEEFVRKIRVVAGAVQFLTRSDSAIPRGNRQLIVTMISHKALRWLSPIFAFVAYASSIALSTYSPWFFLAALGQTLFMLTGVAGCWARLRRVSVVGIAHYFWLVQTAAALGVARGLFGRQPVAWRRFQRATVEPV